MKKHLSLFLALFISASLLHAQENEAATLKIFNEVVFYDGYAALVEHKVDAGVERTNTSYRRKLTTTELQQLARTNTMHVDIKAACDNYDRLGHVSLYIVPSEKPYYEGQTVELGRYITPFMDKNKEPSVRPYVWDVSFLGELLSDKTYRTVHDFYIELSVFGVPYDAQKKVAGCEGRNDVFIGSLYFNLNNQSGKKAGLTPIAFKDSLNNYNKTDTIGKTTRSYMFETSKKLKKATLYIISSNHGANRGGEEYNRRMHYVYLDNKLVYSYKPGEATCEPYRKYNTQGNGIYSKNVKTPEQWQNFSNWCPGAEIPVRTVTLKNVKKGKHIFKIAVPDAVFPEKEGVIPVSAYIVFH